MSALLLKIFAILFMTIDHIGFAIGTSGFAEMGFSDGYWLCRGIGRLALPIFAFLIANGFKHTRSTFKYALRLFVFALISEVPFDIFTSGKFDLIKFSGMIPDVKFDNIFFTLFLGLCFLVAHSFFKKKLGKLYGIASLCALLFFCTLSAFISADYGVIGVAWVALFGLLDITDKNKVPALFIGCAMLSYWKIIAKCIAAAIYRTIHVNISAIPILSFYFSGSINTLALIQPFSLVALSAILLYNDKSGMPKNKVVKLVLKYAFYLFYPAHLIVLWYLFKR